MATLAVARLRRARFGPSGCAPMVHETSKSIWTLRGQNQMQTQGAPALGDVHHDPALSMVRGVSGPGSRLTFDGLLDGAYGLVVEVDAEDPSMSRELEHDALHIGTIAGAMLRT